MSYFIKAVSTQTGQTVYRANNNASGGPPFWLSVSPFWSSVFSEAHLMGITVAIERFVSLRDIEGSLSITDMEVVDARTGDVIMNAEIAETMVNNVMEHYLIVTGTGDQIGYLGEHDNSFKFYWTPHLQLAKLHHSLNRARDDLGLYLKHKLPEQPQDCRMVKLVSSLEEL